MRQESGIASRRVGTALAGMEPGGGAASHAVRRPERAAGRAVRAPSLDLERFECTIEEREEYEPHIMEGTTVYAGVDYEDILRQAENEGDIILWDGGNNDTSFYKPDLDIVVLDPHRPGHELAYWPGEVNFRSAHVLIINKVDTANPDSIATVQRNIALHNPEGAGHRDGVHGYAWRIRTSSRASACWWWKTARR